MDAEMEFTPLVSIIMNCYNSDEFLREAIDSIYAQSYQNWEIIFWDNASTDNSASIAKSYDKRIKYFLANETTPLGEARNLALNNVNGKYIAFLDCDDIYLSDKLEKQVQLLEKTKYVMCYGSAITINENGEEIRKVSAKNNSGYLLGQLLNHYEINMQSVMLCHSVLIEEQLGFSTQLKYCPDHNLFLLIAADYPVAVIQDFLVKYRVVDDSLSRRTVDIAAEEVKFTLDKIANSKPELKQQFAAEFNRAYKKLHYYDAVAAIYKNDRKLARHRLKKVITSKLEYLVLYLLLFLPLSNQQILKLLGR